MNSRCKTKCCCSIANSKSQNVVTSPRGRAWTNAEKTCTKLVEEGSLRSATSATNKNPLCVRHRVHCLGSDLVRASPGFAKQTSGTVRDLLPVLVASVTSSASCCSSGGGTCCCTNCTTHCCTHRNRKPECEQCRRKTNPM